MKTNSRFHRVVTFAFAAVCAAVVAQAGTLYWKGPGNASAAANWCTDETLTTEASAAPTTDDGIVFVAASGNMTWDVNGVELASWTQQAGYAGTVTFKTGKKNGTATTLYGWTDDNGETRILKITGDCVLLSGTWTHTGQPSIDSKTAAWTTGEGVYQLIADVGGNMTLGDGAVITTTGRGFAKGQGPGTSGGGQGSASHGGNGGYKSDASIVKPCYGVYSRPITQGSGGCSSFEGTIGGGVVRLMVGGKLTLSPTSVIRSDGNESTYYPAAGGTVSLIAGEIAGGGTISANGANNTNKSYGGAGGGGRVACVLTKQGAVFPNGFKDIPTAWCVRVGGGCDGYGGTIYFETAADGEGGGEVIVDGFDNTSAAAGSRNANHGAALGVGEGVVHLKKLTIRNGGALQVPAGEKFMSDEYVEQTTSQHPVYVRLKGGELVLKSNQLDYASPSLISSVAAGSVIWAGEDGTGTLNVLDGASMFVSATTMLKGSLHVAGGGKVAQQLSGSGYRLDLTVTNDVTVDAAAEISARGLGYAKNTGPGANSGGVSGMHGGRVWNADATRHCYGSITRPTAYGSGGGYDGSTGGGAIGLTVLGNLRNDGTITADGGNCAYYSGAGGSVWVRAKTLTGAGAFSANGGISTSGGANGKPGSGGRVAVWLTGEDADFEGFANAGGRFEAFGGTVKGKTIQASGGGGAGTVYLQTGAQQEHEGTLIIDNNGANTYLTEICAGGIGERDVTDTEVGDIIIRNGGKVKVDTATLTVHGDLQTGSTLTEVNGGLVFVDAERVSHITGQNTCSHFLCETPGKQLVFGTGADELLTVSDGGSFTVVGDSDAAIVMRGDTADAYWKIAVSLLAEISVEFVDPAKSDASGGQKIGAKNSDAGKTQDNLNWSFVTIVPDAEISWTGAANGNWADGGNWDLERAPVETDHVIIPALTGDGIRYPRMNGFAAHVKTLTIAAGASLNLDGGDLTVDGATVVSGTLTAVGSERIELRGDVTFAQGAFAPARSTVCLAGDAVQTVGFAGARFFELTAEKGGGAVNFSGGFSAENLLTLRATGAWTGTFAPATRYACARLVVDGTVNDAVGLTLTGTGWTLAASMSEAVKGVAVHGCTAGGIAIHPEAPARDDGDNHGWIFNASFATWAGGTGRFADDNCWVGGKAPDADSFVRIDAAGTVTIDEPVTVASLSLGGSSTVTLKVKEPLTVTGSLSVNAGGTLTADAPIAVSDSFLVFADGVVKHSANGDSPCYSVNVTAGDVFVETGGKIDVNGKGYATKGPGCPSEGCVTQFSCGAGHGGIGQAYHGSSGYGHTYCYGSFFQPQTYGSGGYTMSGGGVIRIAASGEVRIDGELDADGEYGAPHYSGSGGSVWITCAYLSGAGWIHAHGGNTSSSGEGYGGGGGRVSICERTARDWSAWYGRVTAYGGRQILQRDTQLPNGSAGTVYFETAADGPGGGEVVIDNNGGDCVHGTELLPTKDPRDKRNAFKNARFTLRNGAKLVVREDVTVGDVMLETANSYIVARDAVLTIRSQQHRDKAGWIGSVSKSGRGDVVWQKPGFVLIVK